jgi:hypothetical protein
MKRVFAGTLTRTNVAFIRQPWNTHSNPEAPDPAHSAGPTSAQIARTDADFERFSDISKNL